MALEAPEWLNVEYVEGILRQAEDDDTIQVIDVFVKPATSKGDNYTSDMMRAAVELTRKQGDKQINEKRSLIFKFEPMVDGPRKEMIQGMQIFDTEISMMTDTLKKMSDMLKQRLSARVLHVRRESPVCLIVEDLAPQGFRMADRQAGLDLDHCLMALRGLAKFHASSVALSEKEPRIKERYRRGMFCADYAPELVQFFNLAVVELAKEVETWPELGKRYAEIIRNSTGSFFAKGTEAARRKEDEFNVLNHGDFWVNNMLFRYDENNKPIEHIFVDFQLCIWTSPAVDLHYFLSTSLQLDAMENHKGTLLAEYLRTLAATMRQLDCKTPPPSMEQLKKCLKERESYEMISSITILPVVVTDKSEVKDIDESIRGNEVIQAAGFKNPIYRKIMAKRIPKYVEAGLMDPCVP